MASAHHLLAAAFILCGLLFLLHVVTVNSIVCKNCNYEDARCNSGDVPDEDCNSFGLCRTVVMHFDDGRTNVTIRDCVNDRHWISDCDEMQTYRECRYHCDTDNCNNVSYVL